MQDVERGSTATLERFVLHIVVDQKRIMNELQGDRGAQRAINICAECTRRCEEQGGTQHSSGAERIVRDGIVQVSAWLADLEISTERLTNESTVLFEHFRHESRGRLIARRSF